MPRCNHKLISATFPHFQIPRNLVVDIRAIELPEIDNITQNQRSHDDRHNAPAQLNDQLEPNAED